MKWLTRERPKIDRIACPWLVAAVTGAIAQCHPACGGCSATTTRC